MLRKTPHTEGLWHLIGAYYVMCYHYMYNYEYIRCHLLQRVREKGRGCLAWLDEGATLPQRCCWGENKRAWNRGSIYFDLPTASHVYEHKLKCDKDAEIY